MKEYASKEFADIDSLKQINIQQYGSFVEVEYDNLTDEYQQEYGDEKGIFLHHHDIQNKNIVVDSSDVNYEKNYFEYMEWKWFVNNLMNHEIYNHFLIVALNSDWRGNSGYSIVDDYEKCFIRDYECTQQYVSSSPKGKILELREYHHDAPTGHRTIIMGLTERELNNIEQMYFDDVINFAKDKAPFTEKQDEYQVEIEM